jgi:hypothetical protein
MTREVTGKGLNPREFPQPPALWLGRRPGWPDGSKPVNLDPVEAGHSCGDTVGCHRPTRTAMSCITCLTYRLTTMGLADLNTARTGAWLPRIGRPGICDLYQNAPGIAVPSNEVDAGE